MFQKPTKPYKIKVESSSFCIFDLKTPVINRSGAKYVQGVRMVPQGLLLLELWLLFNWEVESQTIGAMGRINGQVIFPYLPVAHCLEFRLNFIGMNEMNWNTTYSMHYIFKKSTFCPKCTFIPDLSRIEVQLLKLHDNLPEKSFHCQSIIYKQVQVKCQLAILVSGDIGILF